MFITDCDDTENCAQVQLNGPGTATASQSLTTTAYTTYIVSYTFRVESASPGDTVGWIIDGGPASGLQVLDLQTAGTWQTFTGSGFQSGSTGTTSFSFFISSGVANGILQVDFTDISVEHCSSRIVYT